MKTKPNILGLAVPALAGLGLAVGEVQGQSYAIDWYAIDGGGGTSAGGSYTLSGTIGQPATGTSAGGDFSLTGGFWPGLIVPTPGAPTLYIQWAGANVRISWSPPGVGFGLEMSDEIAPADWSPAPAGNPVEVPAGAVTRFFRLKRP